MANLFVVATPLQLLVAQQVVRQEKLKDTVLLESCFSIHPEFAKSYDLCRMDKLWTKRLEPVTDFTFWDKGGTHLTQTALPTWKKYKWLKKLLKDNDIKTIYLADFQNQTYRFMTTLLAHQGYDVVFYEEGYSHYVPRYCSMNTGFVAKAKEMLLDTFYYLPVYHIRFAHWRNNPNCPYKGLPISKRFNIVEGFHNEPYDVPLKCEPMVSEKLKVFLQQNISKADGDHRVLFLTDPMSEILNESHRYLYFEVVRDALLKLDKDTTLYIKYHPREKKESREKTIKMVEELGIRYRVLSSEVNVPVEYFLLNIHFDQILFFNTSTFFYNGYLFPKCSFTQLLPPLLVACKKANAPVENIESIQVLIDKMNKVE